MNTNFKIQNLVRKNIAALKPYSSARDDFNDADSEVIFLDANENPFETNVNRYPDPQQIDVKAVLARQKGVSIENILLGNGSDEVLDLLFRAFCEPTEDNVITLPPTYGMYKVLAGINNVENREVLLTRSFEPDISAILSVCDIRSKLLFLCSPNNPTGNSFSEESIRLLLETFNGLVVIDEAYIDFSERSGWLHRLSQHPNLVIIQTLSKAYGMAGIRLGICYASQELVSVLNKIKPPYNVNELSQKSAYARLVNPDKTKNDIDSIITEKNKLAKALLQVSFVDTVFHSDANFILARVDDAEQRYRELISHGIVVRNRNSQPLCENTLRFTIGTPYENEQLIHTLKSLQS